MKRRDFLKGLISTSYVVLSGASVLAPLNALAAAGAKDDDVWLTTGSHFGAFKMKRKNGVIDQVIPFDSDKYPSDMINGIKGLVYNPSRVRYPMVRLDFLLNGFESNTSQRGDFRFVRVTWDKALHLFKDSLDEVQTKYGPSGLHAGQTGWRATGQLHSCTSHMQRAVAMHGNFVKKIGDYSTGAGQTILPYILGSTEVYAQGTSWSLILEKSDTIVLWSNDPYKNLQVGWNAETHESYAYLAQLKEKVKQGKIRVISIDPVVTKTQEYLGCEQLYVNPQTDVPLMLGIAHEMVTQNLHDTKFIEGYSLGFDQFLPYLMGESDGIPKTPEWASTISGVSPEVIRDLAKVMTKGRTQIMMGWCVQRQQHGEQPYWMAAVLATMIGQIGLPGGGISYGHHYSGIGVPSSGAAAPGAFPRNLDEDQKPIFDSTDFKGASNTIPVARWIDSILEPGKTIDSNGSKVTYPDIKMMIFSGNNPWNHHQDRNRMKKAFMKLKCIVSIDMNWTATCRFSDIVLPACTTFERNDIDIYGSYANRGLLSMQKMVEPLYESLSDFEIFTRFAAVLGKEKEYTRGMTERDWLVKLYNDCKAANAGKFDMPLFEEFWQAGYVYFGEGKPWTRHADFRNDPEINPLGTPSGLIEIFSRKIAQYNYDDCPGHPTWMEKAERSHGGPGSKKFPICLQSCHPDKRLHSQMCESQEFRETYTVKGREPVYISPADAKERGIKSGDIVRVFNDRGQLLAGAVVSNNYPQSIIRIQEGAWYGPVGPNGHKDGGAVIGAICSYGDPNTLTLDIGTSKLAQACSAYTCLVDFEKYKGKVPEVSSFSGPIQVQI
ncbi:trimethylamine-N-oxide reductase TorA [Shewanella sp. D64]|uniref:trimethylamine-N-oxide reductase TorA n=1 Tax=unclassified Shewanella TaxID=196818 RepID=UPI0022BA6656|nr:MULTISPECIES: trimethylamine-N-oxide reductase TorA [unclassified Shewanella]MEC4726407.1 trimethylamine-N-oxide reductase TorA [Shewanella sp. D64]MEC4738419.1 trimethylamine-N-oxide reductase TorA [Shewanella sp. E94]WBJ94179.1 trimethylamine-N-oxide reductase TorA [Shewanella sp. MTB7]